VAAIAQAPADAVFAASLSKTINPTPPSNLQTNTPTNHINYAVKQTPTSNPKKTKLGSSSPSTSNAAAAHEVMPQNEEARIQRLLADAARAKAKAETKMQQEEEERKKREEAKVQHKLWQMGACFVGFR